MQVTKNHQQRFPFQTPESRKAMRQEISRQFRRALADYERIKLLYEQIQAEITEQREFLRRLNHNQSSLTVCLKGTQGVDSGFHAENAND